MFKRTYLILTALLLSLIMVFCAACKKSDDNTDSTPTEQNTPNFPEIETYDYLEGEVMDLLNFETGLDMYGEKSINIIGDSISQGKNAEKLYDDSWAAIFKKAINKKFGTNNIGFVSFNANDSYGVITATEIHKITPDEKWVKANSHLAPNTPGNFNYTAGSFTGGAVFTIEVNRKEGGIDRHINGFYVYYVAGPTYGKFDVKVNGNLLKTINCYNDTLNYCARTEFIALPENCEDQVKIELIKNGNGYEAVTLCGMSYIDDPSGVKVNNYSLSGIKLTDFSESLLKELSKANIVIFTLGTNDAGMKVPIEGFKRQLQIVVDACKANGSTLIVGDFIWARNGDTTFGEKYKIALQGAANNAEGCFLDFTKLPLDSVLDLKSEKKDSCHPKVEGHKLIAQNLCKFFGLEIK